MYNFYNQKLWSIPYAISKLFLFMKLTTIIVFVAILQASAGSYAQRISLSEKNAQLGRVFDKISEQTGYDFFVSKAMLKKARPVNIQVNNVDLKEALSIIAENQPFEFTIEDNSVLIKEKSTSFFDRIIAVFKDIDVRGRLLNENGEPLANAVIKIKGGTRVTVSNDKGEFFFSKVDENAILQISYVGYLPKEIRAGADLNTIKMERNTNKLDEVNISVNTGYQKIKKDQLTGAATSVSEKQYHQRVAVTGNFLESLEGKVPGLIYNGQTGELSIRGISTFDAVKQPLIVVDGFPTEIDLRTINPNDIVSVSVLRDAAAASIYGVRASNGVIIIETRRGKSGKPTFNINTSVAIQAKPDFDYLKYIGANEYVQLQRESFYISTPASSTYEFGFYKMNPAEEILFKGPRVGVSKPELSQQHVDEQLLVLGSYDNMADYKRLFYRQKQARNINFDVSGGNNTNTYFIGLNYIGEEMVQRGSANQQFNLNLANTIKFSDRFNLDFKGTYTNYTNKSGTIPGYGDFLPYERLTDDKGNALPVTLGPNRDFVGTAISKTTNDINKAAGLYDLMYYPYRELANNTTTLKYNSLRLQGRLNTEITDWLNVDIGGNYENQQGLTDQLRTENAFSTRRLINSMALKDAATGKALFSNLPKGDILKKNTYKLINYTLRGQLNFNHSFEKGKHSISGILGVEQKKTTNDGYTTSFFGYNGQDLIIQPINMGALNTTIMPAFSVNGVGIGERFNSTDYFSETSTDRRFMSYYGQGTYIYNSKYVITGSFRIDKSNLFGVDPKYRNKPLWSAGLNWRLAEEDFIKKHPWINQLQLRLAAGFNGNVPTSNNGAFLTLGTDLNTTFNSPLSYNEILTPENQSLRWETTQNYNLGLDYSFFKNKISGAVDYYIKRTKDVFGQFDADPTTGFNQYNANTASIENRGLEILINSINLKQNKFEWRTQLTTSFNYNKVLAVKATDFTNSQLTTSNTTAVQGLPIGALYSYNYGGLNNIGQPYVLDRFGNQKVLSLFDYGTGIVDVTREDLIYEGTTTPKYVLGLNNQFSLGAFDLSFLFMYYGGHVMRVEQPNPNNIGNFAPYPLQGSSNFWKKPGDEQQTLIPGYSPGTSRLPGYYSISALYGYQYASQFVRKADYIRLRDIILTYRAKAKFLDKAGLRNVQLRLQAQNPFRYTFSGNDIDPDAINRLSGIRTLENQPLYSLTFSTNF